jgi:hypothetical protein
MALPRRGFLISFSGLLATAAGALAAVRSGSFQLKVFQGFKFDDGSIGKSGSDMDLSFFYQMRRSGMISFLGADHIQRFDEKPAPRGRDPVLGRFRRGPSPRILRPAGAEWR